MSVKSFYVFLFCSVFLVSTTNSVFAQTPAPAATPVAATTTAAPTATQPAATTPVAKKATPNTPYDDLKTGFKRCAEMKDRGVRISCYDDIAKTLGFITPEEAEKKEKSLGQIGFWNISEKMGADDIMQTSLRIESSNRVESRSGTERNVVLAIRCTPGKTEAFLDWKAPVATGVEALQSKVPVTYFVSGGEKNYEDWDISSDKYALFATDPISFVRKILNQKKLTIQFTPGGSYIQAASFDISGVEKAVDIIVKNCYGSSNGATAPNQKPAQ